MYFSGWATQTTRVSERLSWQQMLQSRPQGFAIVMATTSTSMYKYQTSTMSGPVLPFCLNAVDQDDAYCSLSNYCLVCIADWLWRITVPQTVITITSHSVNVSVKNETGLMLHRCLCVTSFFFFLPVCMLLFSGKQPCYSAGLCSCC